ncbi:hypothetical protein SprV_0301183200 [Sparganum proliferum]
MTVRFFLIISTIITVVFENVNGTITSISECDRYFKNVSGILGLAFDCFSKYSQPVALCGQCTEIMGQLYDILNDSQTTTDYGLPCFSFINSSSFQSPIRDIVWKVVDTWQNAHCSDCLVELGPRLSDSECRHPDNAETNSLNCRRKLDGSVSSSHPDYRYTAYNNQTLTFFSHLNDTLLCIAPFIHNTSVTILDPVNFPPLDKVTFDATVCTYCNDAYRKLIGPVEAASPNSLAPLHRNEVSNHNFESVDSLNNGEELSRSLSVQFRQRKFDSRNRNFSYDVLQVSHAEENC